MTEPFLGSSSAFSRQQLRANRFTQVSRDVYVLGSSASLDVRRRALAARLLLPGSTVSDTTAALLLNLPVDDDERAHLTRGATEARSERSEVVVHRRLLRADEIYDLDGLPVTTGPRTLTDLAATLALEDLVAVGDVVVRRWGAAEVAAAASTMRRRRGALRMREALPLLDPGSASPAETRGRLRLQAAGFVALRHGVVVRDEHGGWLAEPDLADPAARVAWQHEGEVHFAKGVAQRRKDLDRDELAREQGWQVVCTTAVDDREPDRLIRKMTAAYRRAAHQWGRAVLPPHLA